MNGWMIVVTALCSTMIGIVVGVAFGFAYFSYRMYSHAVKVMEEQHKEENRLLNDLFNAKDYNGGPQA